MPKLIDTFHGDDGALIDCIEALIEMSDKDALVPHGLGGHARKMLSAAAVRLSAKAPEIIAALPQAGGVEPSAWLKQWWNGNRPCTRVDLTPVNEPWLDDLKPIVFPLYATQPSVIPAAAAGDDLTAVYMAGKRDGRKETESLTERYRAASKELIEGIRSADADDIVSLEGWPSFNRLAALATPEKGA